jgi:hypothetical protein
MGVAVAAETFFKVKDVPDHPVTIQFAAPTLFESERGLLMISFGRFVCETESQRETVKVRERERVRVKREGGRGGPAGPAGLRPRSLSRREVCSASVALSARQRVRERQSKSERERESESREREGEADRRDRRGCVHAL